LPAARIIAFIGVYLVFFSVPFYWQSSSCQ
jgi:hypothetical protein